MSKYSNISSSLRASELELERGLTESASWHDEFKDSPYIYIGGLSKSFTAADICRVFSQYGVVKEVNLVRDVETKESRGFAFLKYADQRSTVLAVDNFQGIKLDGSVIRVDHVRDYKSNEDIEMERERRRRDRLRYAESITSELLSGANADVDVKLSSSSERSRDESRESRRRDDDRRPSDSQRDRHSRHYQGEHSRSFRDERYRYQEDQRGRHRDSGEESHRRYDDRRSFYRKSDKHSDRDYRDRR